MQVCISLCMDKQNNGFITLINSCQVGGITRILIEGEGRGGGGGGDDV